LPLTDRAPLTNSQPLKEPSAALPAPPWTLTAAKLLEFVAGVTPSCVMFVPSTVSMKTSPFGSLLLELNVTAPCTYVPCALA
jgi:hypothetical protein